MCTDRPSTAITHHVQGPPRSPPALHTVLTSSQTPSGPVLPHLSGPSVPLFCSRLQSLVPEGSAPFPSSPPQCFIPRTTRAQAVPQARPADAPVPTCTCLEDPSHTHALVLPQPQSPLHHHPRVAQAGSRDFLHSPPISRPLSPPQVLYHTSEATCSHPPLPLVSPPGLHQPAPLSS